MFLKKYRLKDGSIYFHKLYFDLVPKVLIRYSPPFGAYNYAAYLYQPHKYIVALYDEARYFIQRGRRGYSDRDAWNLHSYLAEWMPAALRSLQGGHGHPLGMTRKGWDRRLEIMARGFEAVNHIWEESPLGWKRGKRVLRRGMKLFAEHFLNLWD